MTFTILGAPATKKNSQRIVHVRGKPMIIQSKQHNSWEEYAILQLRSQARRQSLRTITGPVNMCAMVYREKAGRADLLNYLAAVSDALERAGIVENDSQVAGLDGSRLFIDKANPRVEVTLEVME
jgi:Holliday junction resolvase RusA-like endonuclease